MTECQLAPDDLVVGPHGDGYVVYSPGRRRGFLANRASVEVLTALRQGVDLSDVAAARGLVKQISELLAEEPRFIPDLKIRPSRDRAFRPAGAILLPTMDCSLRCTYCFSGGGDSKVEMPWELAEAAVEFVIANAEARRREARLVFHGGGEPTLMWELLVRASEHARILAAEAGVTLKVSIVTNGLYGTKRADWLAENMDSITLSIDGTEDIQNLQRPTSGGGASFEVVARTADRFRFKGAKFSLRATVTQYSVSRLAEMAEYFASLAPRAIQLEPLTEAGRAQQTRWSSPDPDLFVENFRDAWRAAGDKGVELYTSGARFNRCSTQACGAAGSIFCVTPEGWVTSCHRVSSRFDPAAEHFFYGKYSPARRSFAFDQERLAKLDGLSVLNAPACSDCMARWHCSGGCYQENLSLRQEMLLSENIPHCTIRHGVNNFLIAQGAVSDEGGHR